MKNNKMIERLKNEFMMESEEKYYCEQDYLTKDMIDAIEEMLEEDFLYNISYEL